MAKKRSRKYDIRIGEREWIQGARPDAAVAAASLDGHLTEMFPLFDAMETACHRDCCGLEAFALRPREIEQALARLDVREQDRLLRTCISSIEGMESSVVCSQFFRESARERTQVLAILCHVLRVCEGEVARRCEVQHA